MHIRCQMRFLYHATIVIRGWSIRRTSSVINNKIRFKWISSRGPCGCNNDRHCSHSMTIKTVVLPALRRRRHSNKTCCIVVETVAVTDNAHHTHTHRSFRTRRIRIGVILVRKNAGSQKWEALACSRSFCCSYVVLRWNIGVSPQLHVCRTHSLHHVCLATLCFQCGDHCRSHGSGDHTFVL